MTKWWLGLFVVLAAACGFPRPPDLTSDGGGDDQPTGCTRDEDCGRSTPFCVDTVCAVCKASDSCPAARPVCDMTSHDCRTCVKDAECESGACDLAAGICVDSSKILYASPGGTQAAPCARLLPCSLDKAASTADANHPYIVLLPGTHVTGANFFGQTATLCGNGATINASVAHVFIQSGSSVTIRDLKMVAMPTSASFGGQNAISSSGSELSLSNVLIDLTGMSGTALLASQKVTIQQSTFVHGGLGLRGTIFIDATNFMASPIGITLSDADFAKITNSIFLSSSGDDAIFIGDEANTGALGGAAVIGNSFIGGGITCGGEGPVHKRKSFESNIFFNTSSLSTACFYSFNLIEPFQDPGGSGNLAGDPMFVDASKSDFHLRAGSPAIDAGAPVPEEPNTHDHDGRPRPQGSRSDIGAFEYSP